MKQTEIITGGIEKIDPFKVLTYDEAHEKVSKIHNEMIKKITGYCRTCGKRDEEDGEEMKKQRYTKI